MFKRNHKLGLNVIILTAVLILMTVATASAQISGSGWWTSFTFQNATSNNATVVATAYYLTDNSATGNPTDSVTLGGNSSATFHPGLSGTCSGTPAANGCRISLSNPALPSGFEGSVVISSDAKTVAFVSLNNNVSGSVGASGGTARSAYQGVDSSVADTTLFFPSFKNNFAGQSTIFYVQAAGSDSTVTITYTTQEGTPQTYTEQKTILANRSYAFVPSAAGVPSCNGSTGDNCRGGAIVTVNSGGVIAGTVVEYQEGVGVASYVLASGAITPSNTDFTILVPSAKDNFSNATTGIAILNTSSTAATVDLTFTVKGVQGCSNTSVGDVKTTTETIPAQGTTVIRTTAGNSPFESCGVFYSVKIEDQGADQKLAATVNQSGTNGSLTQKAKYNAFAASSATDTVLFPLVKENFGANATGVSIANACSVATTVTLTYEGSSTHVLQTVSMAAGESVTLRNVYAGDPDATVLSGGAPVSGEKYAVTAVADAAGACIVGLAQQAKLSGTVLDVTNYEGFNQ